MADETTGEFERDQVGDLVVRPDRSRHAFYVLVFTLLVGVCALYVEGNTPVIVKLIGEGTFAIAVRVVFLGMGVYLASRLVRHLATVLRNRTYVVVGSADVAVCFGSSWTSYPFDAISAIGRVETGFGPDSVFSKPVARFLGRFTYRSFTMNFEDGRYIEIQDKVGSSTIGDTREQIVERTGWVPRSWPEVDRLAEEQGEPRAGEA